MGFPARVAWVLVFSFVITACSPVSQRGGGEDNGSPYQYSYLSSQEIEFVLRDIAAEYREIAEYSTAQELLGTGNIPGSRSIPILFLGNRSDEERPWVMIIGGHHGDEPDSTVVPLAFTEALIEGYRALDPEISRLISGLNIAVLPVINPYGLDHLTREDENGEDPNRDYPFSPEGVTPNSDGIPLTTAGANAVTELASRYPFSLAISFHTGSEGIFTPWGADGLSSISPDNNMFQDLGSMLSKASGANLRYGPANEYSGLGYLNGAFDDHLYGSILLPDKLYRSDMTLPWSIATATIELGEYKGYNPDYMGGPAGIDDIGSPSDGNIPRGVRICRAACEIALPSLFGEVEVEDNEISFDLTLTGTESIGQPAFYIDDSGPLSAPDLSATEHDYLPMKHFQGSLNISGINGTFDLNAEVDIDGDWTREVPFSEPSGSPRTILSRSREGASGTVIWGTRIEGLEEIDREFPDGIRIAYLPSSYAAGRLTRIDLNISDDAGNPMSLIIRSTVDWNTETTVIPVGEITKGVSSHEFITPVMEGDAHVEVELVTDRGRFSDKGGLHLYPSISILNVITVPGGTDHYRIIVGVDGGNGPTTVFHGISREPDIGWNEPGWIVEPVGRITDEFGPFIIDLDLSRMGGGVYLRVCNFPGSLESRHYFEFPLDVWVTPPIVKEMGQELLIGMSMIHIRGDGLEEVTPARSSTSYSYRLIHLDKNHTETGEIGWRSIHHLTSEEKGLLLESAVRSGFTEDEVTGCWMSYRQLPPEKGEYLLVFHVQGSIMPGSSHEGIDHEHEFSINFTLGSTREEDEDGDDFPAGLVAAFVVILVIVFLISVLRRNAHIGGGDEETDEERISDARKGSRKDRQESARARVRESAPLSWNKNSRNRRTAPGMREWEGGGFK
ncbi:MAG: M14 family metallopeptidase [Thermoplasmatota archaeon]